MESELGFQPEPDEDGTTIGAKIGRGRQEFSQPTLFLRRLDRGSDAPLSLSEGLPPFVSTGFFDAMSFN